jgi:hypothetical protein
MLRVNIVHLSADAVHRVHAERMTISQAAFALELPMPFALVTVSNGPEKFVLTVPPSELMPGELGVLADYVCRVKRKPQDTDRYVRAFVHAVTVVFPFTVFENIACETMGVWLRRLAAVQFAQAMCTCTCTLWPCNCGALVDGDGNPVQLTTARDATTFFADKVNALFSTITAAHKDNVSSRNRCFCVFQP